jgi:F-type H+-transporting ATPase subunit epsilon
MAITVHLDIVSVEQQIFSGLAEMIVVVGALGELGILPGHVALLTPIKSGPVRIIKQGGEEEIFYISGGTLEVQPDSVTILADTIVRASDLDEAKALETKQNAARLLANKKTNIDITQALTELAQATAQLRAIQMIRK